MASVPPTEPLEVHIGTIELQVAPEAAPAAPAPPAPPAGFDDYAGIR